MMNHEEATLTYFKILLSSSPIIFDFVNRLGFFQTQRFGISICFRRQVVKVHIQRGQLERASITVHLDPSKDPGGVRTSLLYS